jgi:protein-S-isoprenylcysteine O-methyltransferase Ste14
MEVLTLPNGDNKFVLYSQSPALFFAWLIWCLLHSLLASRRVKKRLTGGVELRQRLYRVFYVIFSAVTLGALLVWQFSVLDIPTPAGRLWQACRLALAAYGFYMLVAGGRAYDLREFLGVDTFTGERRETATHFRRDGILGRLRHPWYSGGIALVIALGQTPLDRWDWRLLLIAYLVVGALIEERRLVAELGEVYRQYQRQVPMLIPGIKPGKERNGEAVR